MSSTSTKRRVLADTAMLDSAGMSAPSDSSVWYMIAVDPFVRTTKPRWSSSGT